jgi:hypothetical protein
LFPVSFPLLEGAFQLTKKDRRRTEKETSPEFRGTPPAWAPGDAGPEFASRVVQPPRNAPPSSGASRHKKRPARLSTEDYVQGVLRSDRTILARAITLLWGAAVIVSIVSPGNLTFLSIEMVSQEITLWNEAYGVPHGVLHPWKSLADAATLLIILFVLDATISSFR